MDLDPNVITMPVGINGGVIQPPSGDDYLFRAVGGAVQPNGGQNDNHLNTVWLRSPQFYLNGSGDLTVQMAKGMAHGPAPTDDRSVPYSSLANGGWKGVALRSAFDGTFLLAKPRTTEGDAMVTVTFTTAELAPFVGIACTLDLINSCNGGWGWLIMGNVSIPGSGTPPVAVDPFTSWITTHYPGLSDKSPGGTPDGDGIPNLTKFAFGLIPGSGASVNPITSQVDKATGMFQYTRRYPAVSGLTYTVMTSTDLLTWVTDASAGQTVVSATGDVQTLSLIHI